MNPKPFPGKKARSSNSASRSTPAQVGRYGLFRPTVPFEVIEPDPVSFQGAPKPKFPLTKFKFLVARTPFQPGRQSVLVVTADDRQLSCVSGVTNLDATDCEFAGDATDLMSEEQIRGAFKSASKTARHVLVVGSDAYATLKYLCAGGKLKGKLPELDHIDAQILERWPKWQRKNGSMKAWAEDILDKNGASISENRLRTRCLRLELVPNLRRRR